MDKQDLASARYSLRLPEIQTKQKHQNPFSLKNSYIIIGMSLVITNTQDTVSMFQEVVYIVSWKWNWNKPACYFINDIFTDIHYGNCKKTISKSLKKVKWAEVLHTLPQATPSRKKIKSEITFTIVKKQSFFVVLFISGYGDRSSHYRTLKPTAK